MENSHDEPSSFFSRVVKVCREPAHLRRTVAIAFIVGTWLTLLNQGSVLWGPGWDGELLLRMVLNYLTPFVVSNLGLLAGDTEESVNHKR